jgi:hypothetical protein
MQRQESSLEEYFTTSIHQVRSLVIRGSAGQGKTKYAEAIGSELSYMYMSEVTDELNLIGVFFADSIEVLKQVTTKMVDIVRPVVIIDDLTPARACRKDSHLGDFLISLFDQLEARQPACRNTDLCLPAQCIRVFTTNIMDLKSWLFGYSDIGAQEQAVMRRIFFIDVTGRLYTDEQKVLRDASTVDDIGDALSRVRAAHMQQKL